MNIRAMRSKFARANHAAKWLLAGPGFSDEIFAVAFAGRTTRAKRMHRFRQIREQIDALPWPLADKLPFYEELSELAVRKVTRSEWWHSRKDARPCQCFHCIGKR